jgi:hypothetical protein
MPTVAYVAARARCQREKRKVHALEKPMLVKAVYPVAAGGFGCNVA